MRRFPRCKPAGAGTNCITSGLGSSRHCMSDDLNQESEENSETMDFHNAEANYEDDPAVQEAMLRGFPGPPIRSTQQHLDELADQAAEVYSIENNDQPSITDENK